MKVLSVTEIRLTPFCQEGDRAANRRDLQLRPGRQRPAAYALPSWVQTARVLLYSIQLRAAVVPVVDADVAVLPAVLQPHRRPDPLPPGQLGRGHLDRGELIAGERVGRPRVTGSRPGRPDHLLGGDRHPPVRDRRPVRPQPPISPVEIIRRRRGELAAQVTATLVTLAEVTVPDPLDTAQDCPDGFVFTVTLYGRAVGQRGGERERPVRAHAQVIPAVILQHHRPGQPRDRPADRVRRGRVAQVTATLVTLAEPTVPDPLDTVQDCPDGFVFTVTL